jgi:hypothetical protein
MSLLSRVRAPGPRRLWLPAMVAVLGAMALVAGPSGAAQAQAQPAQAQPAQAQLAQAQPLLPFLYEFSRYQDYNTRRCYDSNYAGAAYTDPCYSGGDTFQEWAEYPTEYSFTLQNEQTRRCLDSDYAGSVYTSPCDGDNTYENWSVGGEGPAYTLEDYQTHRCLDSNTSGHLYTSPCNWNDYYENWIPLF